MNQPQTKGIDFGMLAVAGLGLGAAGLGLYILYRKTGIKKGDKATLSGLNFEYKGPDANLFICWGLIKGDGNFNNGENLAAGVFAWGGPIKVTNTAVWEKYSLNEADIAALDHPPIYEFTDRLVWGRSYGTYKWISVDEATDEEIYFCQHPDTDADVFNLPK